MKKIYIAGKLNADAVGYIKNVYSMIYWANIVRRMGFSVFVPAADFMMGLVEGNWEYKDYFDNSQPWLECSDAVFVCPNSEESKGTQAEIKRAIELKIPVFHTIAELEKIK